ncbi:MAG TPA: hypothetical protein VGI99_15330 [Gemmataceae bacterium]|jgi:hypothetical protein
MTAHELRRLYWSEPFEAFQLDLNDGRQIVVASRDWLAISPTNDTIVVAPTILEMEIVDIPAIVGCRYVNNRAAVNGAA